jgi:PAS domain S-box-containing protein
LLQLHDPAMEVILSKAKKVNNQSYLPANPLQDRIDVLASLIKEPSAETCPCVAIHAILDAQENKTDGKETLGFLDLLIKSLSRKHLIANEHKRQDHSREKLLQAAVFSNLSDGMIVIDSSEKIYIMNPRAREMLGYDAQEKLRGAKYSKRFLLQNREGRTLPKSRDPVHKTFTTGVPTRVTLMDDIYCARKNSLSFPITLSVSPFSYNKKVRGVVVIFEDITREKKVDEVKSDFIYIASHQLRTPLTVSTLHTEMLLAEHGGQITKEQREFLNEILFYNKKMAQLLSVFMTVSKIEMGKFEMQEKPVDLRLLMDDVLHELGTQIKNKRLIVRKHYDDSLPIALTDQEFIRIVFQNLVSNAVKYTPHDGNIIISVGLSQNNISVAVEDSGCGIPQREQSQVFTKLYRGTNMKGHRWDSNGLGLYITKSIVDKCGGSITFTSEEDKGTIFNVILPIKTAAEGDTAMMV